MKNRQKLSLQELNVREGKGRGEGKGKGREEGGRKG